MTQTEESATKHATLYAACIAEGIETDSYRSDLYIPDTPRTRELLAQHGHGVVAHTPRRNYRGGDRYIAIGATVEPFRSQLDGTAWLSIFGAFDPFWGETSAPKGGTR